MSHTVTLVQINDVHGYLEPHNEVYWGAQGLEYRTAGGYAVSRGSSTISALNDPAP